MTLPGNVAGGSSTSYNADNEQSMLNGTAHSYDNNGNLTGDGTNTYSWDARNHLSTISQGRTTVGSFVYDGFGRRMKKAIGGTTTQFLYDGLNPVQELDGANPPNVTANLLTGLGIDERFTRTDASGAMSFLTDALGSTIGLADATGTVQTSYTYDPFGGASSSGGSANPYQFTGRENDGNGLYFYRARYYSPTYQRFIAQDPIDFAGGDTNLYEYAGNDPIGLLDAKGTGPALAVLGFTVCELYFVYRTQELLSEERQLDEQLLDIRKEIPGQDSCPRQRKSDSLENQAFTRTEQFTEEHTSDVVGEVMTQVACLGIAAGGMLVP
ncbi:MAG: RHS repeat-associated core domain-containing protein [Candidatus Binataceae bacterium]|nr:RHS repeat-associated core domain-containing protein [Candidatus Binataceae bacterium]